MSELWEMVNRLVNQTVRGAVLPCNTYIYINNGDGNQRVDQTMHYKVKAATYSEAT